MQQEQLLTWVLGGVATMLAGAATVISMLYKINESRNSERIKELQEQHEECEERYEQANGKILALSIRVAALEAELGKHNKDDKPHSQN